MNYRQFGNTSLQVSEIGFGAWAIGGNAMVGETAIGWGKVDDAVSRQAIAKALDKGINFFDTADVYGLGHSEEMLGEMLYNNRDVIIATKAGNVARQDKFGVDYSAEHIVSACEASLRRLRREVIDYYQLHSARLQHLQEGECIEAMQLLQQQGKIRYWGLSLNTFDAKPEADYLLNKNLGRGFQLVFNLINQRALPIMKKAYEHGYGTIIRMPLQFGLLTGKFSSATTFDRDDHRHKRLTPEIITASNNILEEKVWPLCSKYNTSKTAIALSFILGYKEVSTIITGIRTPQQAEENTSGLVILDEADKLMLEQLFVSDWADVLTLMEKQG